MKVIDEISVFFPTYNEEKNIKNTVLSADRILKEIAGDYEIIVVDDGSSDKTAEIVTSLSEQNNRIKLIRHEKNKGYGAALISGFYNSQHDTIVFTDSDGQFDFSEIDRFIKTQERTNADLVVGYYIKRKVSNLRKFNSLVWKLSTRLFCGVKVKELDCGFKLIKKRVIDSIPQLEAQRGAFISPELLAKAKARGFRIVEIPVTHFARKEGEPTGANIKVLLSSFKDLFRLRGKLKLIKKQR